MSTSFATSSYRPTGQPSPAEPVGVMAGGWFTALSDDDPDAHRYLLALRFGVVNLIAFAVLGAAWLKGWVGLVIGGDTTQLVLVITLVFVFGVVNCARKVYVTSVELNQANEPQPDPSSRAARYLATVVGRDGHGRATR